MQPPTLAWIHKVAAAMGVAMLEVAWGYYEGDFTPGTTEGGNKYIKAMGKGFASGFIGSL